MRTTTLAKTPTHDVDIVHHSDWSGPAWLRMVSASRIITTEIEIPPEGIRALVDAVLLATVTDEERELAARLLAIGKRGEGT